jgi:hypothetical protein
MQTPPIGVRRGFGEGPTVGRRNGLLRTAQAAEARIRITALGLVTFVAGLGAAWKVNLVGEIYVAELMIMLLLIVALPLGLPKLRGNRTFAMIVAASALTMAGYVISDMVRGTSEAQYLRGWARNALVIVSTIVLAAFAAKDKRTLWWFLLGLAVGSIAWFELVQRLPIRSPHFWKFNYATSFTLLVACSAAFLPRQVVALLFVALGTFSVFKDFRIHGAICVLVGIVLWTMGATDQRKAMIAMFKMGIVAAIGMAAAIFLVSITQNEYTNQRREASNVGRILGIQVGLAAIAHSPVIGYGSWPTSPELIRISREVTQSYEDESGRETSDLVYTNAHSQILNSWMEGGILGASLYIAVFVLSIGGLIHGVTKRPVDFLTPLIAFLFITTLWNLVMSPLGSAGRLLLAASIAMLVVLAAERKLSAAQPPRISRSHRPRRSQRATMKV